MGRPGYYITDPNSIVEFPVAPRPDAVFDDREGIDIHLQAERGKLFNYKQGEFGKYAIPFRVNDTDLAVFRTLHDAVDGRTTPFFYVPDVDASPLNAVEVRKERDFKKRPVMFRWENGTRVRYWDYTLELTEEIDTEFEIET